MPLTFSYNQTHYLYYISTSIILKLTKILKLNRIESMVIQNTPTPLGFLKK